MKVGDQINTFTCIGCNASGNIIRCSRCGTEITVKSGQVFRSSRKCRCSISREMVASFNGDRINSYHASRILGVTLRRVNQLLLCGELQLRINEHLPAEAIAKLCKCSVATVYVYKKKGELRTLLSRGARSSGRPTSTLTVCDREFTVAELIELTGVTKYTISRWKNAGQLDEKVRPFLK